MTGFCRNYYVDSKDGNDNNNGLSPSSSWRTITKINNFNFSNGDTISFKCGQRFLGKTIIPNCDSLTFNSYGSGPRPVIDGQGKINCLVVSNKNHIYIKNLKFVNGLPRDITLTNDNFVTIENCNIDSSSGTGILDQNIYTGMGSHLIIKNSTISYAGVETGGGHGIYIDGTKNTLLEYDTLLYNKNDNIKIAYGYQEPFYTDSLTVRYCIIKYAGDENISDDGSKYSEFYYNVFENQKNSWSENISLTTAGSYCASYNQYFNNTIIIHDPGDHDNAGIFVYTSPNITNIQVYNNIFFIADSLKGWAIYSEKEPIGNWTINNNLYYSVNNKETHIWHWEDSTLDSFKSWQSDGFDTNGFYGNPLFNSLDSLRLQNQSPAINMGQPTSISRDIEGNLVPSPAGTKPDAGAFENTVSYGIRDSLQTEIMNVSISKITNSVLITWETASGTNNKGFEIERNLLNFSNNQNEGTAGFKEIGFVLGKGNSSETTYYKFVDDYSKLYYTGTVEYRIKQIDLDGTYSYSKLIKLNVDFGINGYSLSQNYPNPFNPVTVIHYEIPNSGFVTLKVYNSLGKLVTTLVDKYQNKGKYDIDFSTSGLSSGEKNLASGVYFYQLRSGSFLSTKKMMLIK